MNLVKAFHSTYEWLYGPGKIGPHEGRIAELMLEGKKPICHLTHPYETEDIKTLLDAIRDGKLSVFRVKNREIDLSGNPIDSYYFCQKGKEEDMLRLHQLFDHLDAPIDYADWEDRSIEIGHLLGYSDDDINMFLDWCNSPMLQVLTQCIAIKKKIFPDHDHETPVFDYTELNLDGVEFYKPPKKQNATFIEPPSFQHLDT